MTLFLIFFFSGLVFFLSCLISFSSPTACFSILPIQREDGRSGGQAGKAEEKRGQCHGLALWLVFETYVSQILKQQCDSMTILVVWSICRLVILVDSSFRRLVILVILVVWSFWSICHCGRFVDLSFGQFRRFVVWSTRRFGQFGRFVVWSVWSSWSFWSMKYVWTSIVEF